jgi:hypothetical protein
LNELSFLRSVCGELGNRELFEKTLTPQEGEIEQSELKARLLFLSHLDGSFDMDAGVIASHFYSLSDSDLDQVNLSVLQAILSDSSLVVRDEDSLFDFIHRRASKDLSYFGLLEFVRFEFLSIRCIGRAVEFISTSFDCFTIGIWSSLRSRLRLPVTTRSESGRFKSFPLIDSKILSEIPPLFSVFGDQMLQLLYRGSRDGFEAATFHRLCNGHPNTVTLILSTNGCIFGGFTPLTWSSCHNYVSDPSMKCFLFTLKNPHNLPAQIFKQKIETHAIYDDNGHGPTFGGSHALHVCNQCRSSSGSYSYLGDYYANDTGIDASQVLTGSQYFTVDEIEVFEVVSKS